MTDDLNSACEVLREGGLILYPTDTVWGVGCDATCAKAVERIYALKQRADRKAMLVLIGQPDELNTYVAQVPPIAWDLIAAADRPLTIIYPKGKHLASGLPGEDGSIGIRITHEWFSRSLCERFRKPVVSTSANLSGQPAPASFGEISETIRQGVDYIVRYRQEETVPARPSSILRIDDAGRIRIIRE